MTTPLVEAKGLTKIFNRRKAVDGIDFVIRSGEVVGFLGPNGAGKTTTIRMLLNILMPTSGDLRILGHTYARHKSEILRQMNASSGALTLPGKLSVEENLKVFADFYAIASPRKRIDHLIQKFGLSELRKRVLYSLSTGQQVRVSLAKAFLNKPRLLLLDEPTASLDPDVANRVRSFLTDIVREEQTTVFLTSHNMAEVEQVCTRVLFLNQGRIQAEGSPAELARRTKRWVVRLQAKSPLKPAGLAAESNEVKITVAGDGIEAEMDQADIGPFITRLVKQGVDIEDIHIQQPTLEDFFVHTARQNHGHA